MECVEEGVDGVGVEVGGEVEGVKVVRVEWMGEARLARLLRRENELRLSEEVQRSYEAAERSDETDWMAVSEDLQIALLKSDGIADHDLPIALYALRTATHSYPALARLPLYVKYNRSRRGELRAGDPAPDVPLLSLDGTPSTSLLACARAGRPLVVVGGSYS